MRKILISSALLLAFFSFYCDNETVYDKEKFIKDDAGNVFSLDSVPKRIISLAPNITETIFELKADDILVGVTDYCDFPPEAEMKAKVGSMLDPNIEKITELNPDVIFMTMEGNSKYTYFSLKKNGFKVFVSNPKDVNSICKSVNDLGVLLGKKDIGKKITEKIMDTRNYYLVRKSDSKSITCFMIVSLNPLITVNKFTYINELMELAGLKNIYADELLEYPNVNYEDVLIKNPDCIFFLCDTANVNLLAETYSEIKNRLSIVNACRNNKIFGLDENIISRPGPRVMDGIKILQSKVIE